MQLIEAWPGRLEFRGDGWVSAGSVPGRDGWSSGCATRKLIMPMRKRIRIEHLAAIGALLRWISSAIE
jgi:hypothetical protein